MPRTSARSTLPTGRTDEQAVDRQAVVIGPQRQAVEIDVDTARRDSGATPTGSPTERATGVPTVPPARSWATPPGRARCSRPANRRDTPVMPTPGRNVAVSSPAVRVIPGSPLNRISSALTGTTATLRVLVQCGGRRRLLRHDRADEGPLPLLRSPGSRYGRFEISLNDGRRQRAGTVAQHALEESP